MATREQLIVRFCSGEESRNEMQTPGRLLDNVYYLPYQLELKLNTPSNIPCTNSICMMIYAGVAIPSGSCVDVGEICNGKVFPVAPRLQAKLESP